MCELGGPFSFSTEFGEGERVRERSPMPSEKMSGYLDLHVTEDCTNLPPGFRFHPTDEELLSYYLKRKVLNGSFVFQAIGEVDFNKCEPWDLPARAKMGESMFYFFTLRDRKYPTGMRTNRATEAGYWKATGKDREVLDSGTGKLVGMKKTLVFYTGRAPKGEKTNWIMHEYRLEGESTIEAHHHEWVVCRIFEKNAPAANKRLPPLVDNYDGLAYNPKFSDNKDDDDFVPSYIHHC